MDGFGMLIRSALAAFGVEVDPKEIADTIETAKRLIPKIAETMQSIDDRLTRIEKLLQPEPATMPISCPGCDTQVNAAGHCDDCKTKFLES